MSSTEIARRAKVAVSFGGADISASLKKYLIGLTYIDNEDGEADDLQLRLHDRDGLWVEQWLAQAVAGAKGDGGSTGVGGGTVIGTVVNFTGKRHYVSSTGDNGYATRQGPGRITAVNPGAKHPYHLIHTDGSTNLYGWVDAGDIEGIGAGTTSGGDWKRIEAVIAMSNRRGDGEDEVLQCGSFELDTVNADGPPSTVIIKATSLPADSDLRQTKKNGAWENTTLRSVAEEKAREGGMTCLFLCKNDPSYERLEQFQQSDISFLKALCDEQGVSLKVTNKMVVLFDQADFEHRDAVRVIRKGKRGGYTEYHLGYSSKEYQSCRVSYNDPRTGKSIQGVAKGPNWKKGGDNRQLEITAKVESVAQAEALAAKYLRLYQKGQITAEFTMPGEPALCAGCTVELIGWGLWDGRYIITQAQHTVDAKGGYYTTISLRRALEGY